MNGNLNRQKARTNIGMLTSWLVAALSVREEAVYTSIVLQCVGASKAFILGVV